MSDNIDNITAKPMEPKVVVRLSGYLLVVTSLSAYLIISLWSSPRQFEAGNPPAPNCGTNTTPRLTNVYPSTATVAAFGDVLLVGCGFLPTTVARINGVQRSSTFADSSHIRVALTANDVTAAGAVVLTLLNGSTEFGTGTLTVAPPAVYWRLIGFGTQPIHPEVQLLLLVLFTGVFGSSVYSLKSLGDYRGDNRLYDSWHTFYVIQPFAGMGIAFLLYVVVRGGFLAGAGGDSSAVNQFGICAIAGLAGAFSDTAFLKLRELFQTMFKPQDDRGGKIGPKITTASLAPGIVGKPYNQSLQATGGVLPLKWSVTPALPSPLTLDPSTGVITGTPTATFAQKQFTFNVADSASPAATASVNLAIEIKPAFQITTTALTEGRVATAYNQALQASGGAGTLRWTVSPALPTGLALDQATGVITGTPTAPLSQPPFRFTVTDSATPPVSVNADLALEIKPAAQAATP